MEESETRRLALLPPHARHNEDPLSPGMPLADVFTLHGRRSASSDPADEQAFFLDVLAEYQWARDAVGLMPGTIDKLVKPVIELCDHYATVPWRIEPKHLDRYFAGVGKRARSAVRAKITNIDGFYAFLEQRYAGEISRLFGAVVESPVDPFNRPRHRGDFGLRVPPSQRAMTDFFARWRKALPAPRKEAVACRDYVMAKIAYLSGVRAGPPSCAAWVSDVHWESGQWGRFIVEGKDARGLGPR
ncbi:hypothetical protein [Streptomyces griseorubiginosus]|uniref:hypothetical protein n=1 Tax=Streptomyces griseorubiginosus TaxID=67304 RepID=UPI003320D3D4